MSNSTVVIVDDDVGLCKLLSYLLESVNLSTEVYHSSQAYLDHYNPQHSCLLIDVRMPDIGGIELQRRLVAMHNRIPIIFMTAHGDVDIAVQAMKQGAKEFITKPMNDNLLLDLIQKAITQENSRSTPENGLSYSELVSTLTKREREVLQGMMQGKINKVIAFELGISNKTVELHRSHVMKKTRAKSIAELVKKFTLLENFDDTVVN
jgi:two-component system response regulator FixJ